MATCKKCGATNLSWINNNGKWFLFEGMDSIHRTDVRPHACHAAAYERSINNDIKASEPKPTGTTCKCGRCGGTGQFITYVENGVPKGPGGICFTCEGKGYLTDADNKRNHWYFAKYMRVSI